MRSVKVSTWVNKVRRMLSAKEEVTPTPTPPQAPPPPPVPEKGPALVLVDITERASEFAEEIAPGQWCVTDALLDRIVQVSPHHTDLHNALVIHGAWMQYGCRCICAGAPTPDRKRSFVVVGIEGDGSVHPHDTNEVIYLNPSVTEFDEKLIQTIQMYSTFMVSEVKGISSGISKNAGVSATFKTMRFTGCTEFTSTYRSLFSENQS